MLNIIKFIPEGKINAISTKELMQITNLTQRNICSLIEKARNSGEVILSSSKGGYWQPDYTENNIKDQLTAFINFMNSKNTYSTTKTAKQALKQLENDNQMRFRGL